MVAPIDKQFDTIMRNRYPRDYKYHKYEFFSETTKKQLSRLFRLILESERTIDKWRKKLKSMSRYDNREIFDKIDTMKKNYLVREDVKT